MLNSFCTVIFYYKKYFTINLSSPSLTRNPQNSFGHKWLCSKEIKSVEQKIVLDVLTEHLLLCDAGLWNDVILIRDKSLSHFGDIDSKFILTEWKK